MARGRLPSWESAQTFLFLKNVDGFNDELWSGTTFSTQVVVVQSKVPTEIAAGNLFETSEGHWASWLQVYHRISVDGELSLVGDGLSLAWPYVLYVDAEILIRYNCIAHLADSWPLPSNANEFHVGPGGTLTWGTFGDVAWGDPENPTVLEHKGLKFGVPRFVTGPSASSWLFHSVYSPSLDTNFVVGRPVNSNRCIVFPFGAVDPHVVFANGEFHVAGADPQGNAQWWSALPAEATDSLDELVGEEPPVPAPVKPAITVLRFDPVLRQANDWASEFEVSTEPGTKVKVEFKHGELYFTYTRDNYGPLTDKTAKRRLVQIGG